MTMDPMVVRNACRRWRDCELLRLPRSTVEPVIWVQDNQLCMYHPAMELEQMNMAPRAWDRDLFLSVANSVAPEASNIIGNELLGMKLPTTYFAEYPGIVATYSFSENVPEEATPIIPLR